MKKVLMIAFIYPPLGGSGVQRTLKFSKYLPQFSWQPYVVSSDSPGDLKDGLDTSLVDEIPPEVKVWRRPFISPLYLRRWVQKLLGLDKGSDSTSKNLSSYNKISGTDTDDQKSSLLNTLAKPLRPFEFPPIDAALYWSLAIIPGCLKLIHQEKIDLIFSTSFPYSDHVAGYVLKKLTGKPWVADFRDPWSQNKAARNTGWRYRIDHWMEQRVLLTADRVIGVTPTYTKNMSNLASSKSADDFITIENGYDQTDFDLNSLSSKSHLSIDDNENCEPKPVVLAHVGHVYEGFALPIFHALEGLGSLGDSINLLFISELSPCETSWLAEHNLSSKIHIISRQPHNSAVKIMKEAQILLLLLGSESGWFGCYQGKLFEYMASGTPILFVGPQGDTAELIKKSGTGCFISVKDNDALLKMLKLIALQPNQFIEQYYHPRPEIIARYERRALTKKLANVFDTLLKVNHG